jgi:hypothetical protein
MNYKDLPEEIKEELRDKHRYVNVDELEWWDGVYAWAKEDAAKFGLHIENIYFSGFSSQGDGASFEGYLESKECDAATLPEDVRGVYSALHEQYAMMKIADPEPEFSVRITQRGNYSHENTMHFEFRYSHDDEECSFLPDEETIEEALRDYARWIYRTLEKAYDYLTSDEAIDDYLNCQDYNEQGETQ